MPADESRRLNPGKVNLVSQIRPRVVYVPPRKEPELHLARGERRLMHALLDLEDGEERFVDPNHTEKVVLRLIELGFLEVRVTERGRRFIETS